MTQYRIPDTPLVEGDRAKLTTTLNRLKAANACAERYRHLVQALGGVSFDHDAPINLLTILDLNGVDDCLWALHTTAEDCERQTRLIIADCAESVLYLFERERPDDNRPRVAIEMARRLARGEVDSAASDAARAAAWAAASDAAWVAARAAAWVAASDAAWSAASDAARAAQRGIIRRYLIADGECA